MVRKNKRRFLISLFVLTFYGGLMAYAGLESRWDPFPAVATWFILTPIAGYLLGMIWQFDLVLRVRESDSSSVKVSQGKESPEKRKRQVIDDVLRDLSDEDLYRLRQRLQDGTIDDEVLYERTVGDDGELVQRN